MWISNKNKVANEKRIRGLENETVRLKNKVDYLEKLIKDNQLLNDVISDEEKINILIVDYLKG